MNNYQIKRIAEAMEKSIRLTAWEHDFIVHLSEKDESEELSEKENHKLNEISQKMG